MIYVKRGLEEELAMKVAQQSLGREVGRLAAFGDRFDDLRRKERHPDQSPHVAALDQS